MRRRLLAALTVFATIAVLAFAAPLCSIEATSRTQQLLLGRSADADWFASLADTAATTGDTHALAAEVGRYHQLYGEPVLIVDARGQALVNAGVDPADPEVQAALAAARRNQRPAPIAQLLPWTPDAVLIARPLGSGVQVDGAVVIQASTAAARADILRTWGIVGGGALAAMALFTALALLLARWVLRPLNELSTAVAALTASLPTPRHPVAPITRHHRGPPEILAVAESVDTMAAAVVDSQRAQRQLVADTAHAMRNPLAALTIRLDSLQPAIPDQAAPTFRGAVTEADRLTALLDGLLSLAVAEADPELDHPADIDNHCAPAQVICDRIDAWHTAFDRSGLRLTADPGAAPDIAVPAAVLARILDVALSNASRYAGQGLIRTCRPPPPLTPSP
ncbi:sensor histidine kinase [Nocardia sp. NPDC051570]|uniref:sensor histidine kinase n=1 Tax=Nocardia sp. NPDC051570 TaxID=3364324 RepID=UPI0037959B0A